MLGGGGVDGGNKYKENAFDNFYNSLISDGLSHMNFISVSQQYIELLDQN